MAVFLLIAITAGGAWMLAAIEDSYGRGGLLLFIIAYWIWSARAESRRKKDTGPPES
jgi:hypothetical protein